MAGMSLVEVLVAMVILAIGMLAIVRLFLPGVTIIPGQQARKLASQLSASVVEEMAVDPELRPYAVVHALPADPASPPDPSLGYELIHDVSLADAYQYSDQVTQVVASGDRILVFPTFVIGERFRAPALGPALTVAHLCERGPVRPGSGWVYYPTPVPEVGNIADPRVADLELRWQPVDWDTGQIQFDMTNIGAQQFRACYTYVGAAGSLVDMIGEPVLGLDILTGGGVYALAGGAAIVPNSVTIYEEVGGVFADWALGPNEYSLGAIRIANPNVEPGEMLAVTYETQSHLRAGFETGLSDPRDAANPIEDFYIPDIVSQDAAIPAISPKTVRLPHEFLLAEPLANDATYTHLPYTVVAVDALLGQLLYLDSADPQAGITAIDYHTGEILFDDDVVADILARAGANPAWVPTNDMEWPVRVYYRADGGWATEMHLAPEGFAAMAPEPTSATGWSMAPAANPSGIRQFWYTFDPNVSAQLNFYDAGAGGMIDDGGFSVAVDYVYDADLAPLVVDLRTVRGETHMISLDTHSITLNHAFDPADPTLVQGIRSVRGMTLKVRTCWEEDFERHYADVDEPFLAME